MIIASSIFYGLMPLMAKICYSEGSNPIEVCFLRFSLGSLVLFLYIKIFTKESILLQKHQYFKLFKVAIFYAVTPIILFMSYSYLASGLASSLHFVFPCFVILISILVFKEKLTQKMALSLGLSMLGIGLFVNFDGSISLLGILLAISSGLTYAIYIILIAHIPNQGISSLKYSFYLCSYSSIILLIVGLLLKSLTFNMGYTGYLSGLALAISSSLLSTVLFQEGVKLTNAETASLLSTFEPLTSVFVGILLFKEKLGIKGIFGIIFILLSAILLSIKNKEKEI